jgi:hypothetical protein
MPRARLPQLHSITDGSFEPNRKNPILLGDDDVLDTHQKTIKIGGENTPLSLSKDELRINGDLFLNGKLTSHVLECDSDYLTFRPNIYTRFESTDYQGHLDLYVASGIPYWMPSSNTSYFINNGRGFFNFGTLGQVTMFQMNLTGATFTIQENDDSENYLQFSVYEHGATKIKTHDEDATVAHLTLEADGDLILDPVSQKTIINATDKLYFDGGTHTYILETSDDQLDFYVGADNVLRLEEGVANSVNAQSADITIDATYKLFFDGTSAGHTYIAESSDDVLGIYVGGDIMMQLSEKGDDGNEVSFGSSCVGFTQLEPTYDATDTEVDFRHSNKQFLTFGSGNITNLKLTFPLVSGNFVLLIKQDGTGSRTITNYRVYEFDESTADGHSAVKFAGGSSPTLTTDANHVDIISFYWDADNEIAYGVATLDFQF